VSIKKPLETADSLMKKFHRQGMYFNAGCNGRKMKINAKSGFLRSVKYGAPSGWLFVLTLI
jgi:hypothetical protein